MIDYYSAIELAVQDLSVEAFELRVIINELHEAIVDHYNGDVFANYKRGWVQAVLEYFKSKKIDLLKTRKPNWEDISAVIIDRLAINSYDFQKEGKSVAKGSVTRRSFSSAATSSASDTSSSDVLSAKQVKLSDEDKNKIKNMYARLDKSKMWKLSTGTLVEEQMMKHALSQDYEHLSHSLILNVRDSSWYDYFSSQEIDEIKRHKAVQLPVLPYDIKTYIDELKVIPKSDLFEKVNQVTHAPNTDKHWIQDTYNNCVRLVQSGFFGLHDVTEQGMSKRLWSCVDKCFDFSNVRCITGEKCSKASADAANSIRSPGDLTRQQCGRKVDFLFKTKNVDVELGCGECALVGGIHTTKEFQDAGFKMPKVMRDMLFKIVSRSPAVLHKLQISGFYIADNMLTLYILDSPVGYVSRYDAFNPVEYPALESKIRSQMPVLLTLILSARIIMETCQDIIENDESVPDLSRFMPTVMEPCFIPIGTNYKKRKQ